jgi:hypothetical protein
MKQGKDFPVLMFLLSTCDERLAGITLAFETNFAGLLATQEKYLYSVGSWRHDGQGFENDAICVGLDRAWNFEERFSVRTLWQENQLFGGEL